MDALVELTAIGADAGGKARGLARLAALGLPVPPALVLPAEAYVRWRASRSLAESDFRALGEALGRLGAPLAVRSSALDEDADDRSAAGQYESVMGVRDLPALVAAVERCYRAAGNERATAYRGGGEAELALVVQREVAADRAGIAFSADPVTGESRDILLEVVFGHGERVVSGVAAPDRFHVPRDGGRVRARIAAKPEQPHARRFARTLRDDEARLVATAVLRAETGFGSPVDVEFCFDGPELWLVQCRPITTLARAAA
ncbi:MAG: PEP/pyruvate-binding domain-containing protein [Actinobacteria bacterium]|nr:PEP/pyruvate-binding domain-containing protein [Actinomycetota bacterium]